MADAQKMPGETRHAGIQSTQIDLDVPGLSTVLAQARPLLDCDLPALILGETGSGKSQLARWIHANSNRRDGPFQIRGAGDFHDENLVSELFGHRKGAFTGADRDKQGLFRACSGGTLVLDDIDALSSNAQRRLLHVLENGWVTPLGAPDKRCPVDVRILATANTPIGEPTDATTFRTDLYYRLAMICIRMPALRDRSDDLPRLVSQYQARFRADCPRLDVGQSIGADTIRLLQMMELPGNNRELRGVVYTLMLKAVSAKCRVIDLATATTMLSTKDVGHDYLKSIKAKAHESESFLVRLMEITNRNVALTARLSGYTRQGLYAKPSLFK